MKEFKAAKAVIVKDDKILLIKKADTILNSPWELPGGKLEEDEDYFTALKREVKEETDIDVEIGRQLADWFIQSNEKGFRIDGKSWLCKPLTNAIKLSKEHSEYSWIDKRDAQKFKIAEAFKPVILSWLKLR